MEAVKKIQILDINILDLVLTPLTCASIISEILKCLIYEKSLIPYPYNWLKYIVLENRATISKQEHDNFSTERQNRLASAAFNATENIIAQIKKLFQFGNNITEFMAIIGSTPLNPKEIYRIKIPNIAKGHNESSHSNTNTKFQQKVMRSILLSEQWMSTSEQILPVSNLYIFVKIADGNSFLMDDNTLENFIPSPSFHVPKNVQSLTINLLYDNSVPLNCCKYLTVYEDKCIEVIEKNSVCNNGKEENSIENKLLDINIDWLQMNSFLKGFK